MEIENINIREEYYTDIHEMKPKWWMRWGILTVFIVLSAILILGYIVKYPDVIQSNFRLTTNKPSVTLPMLQGQQIKRILKSNGENVIADAHLILFENDSKYEDVILLSNALKSFSFHNDTILQFFDTYLDKNLQLGSFIESNWIAFSNELLEYYKIQKLESYQAQVHFLKNELSKQIQLKRHYANLIKTDKKQQQLLNKKIATDSILLFKGVISKMDFNTNKRQYYNTVKILQQNNLGLKRVNLEMTRLQNSIENIRNTEVENLLSRKLGIRKSLNKLLSSIELWKRKNVLVSSIAGRVNFIQDIKEGGFYEGNILIITPEDKNYYASIQIPFAGAGKVEKEQRTVLKLNDYPYREYGIIEGQLDELSAIAGESFYLGKVILEKNKISSYGKKITLRESMTGICEIITKDRSILERLFEKITYAFTR